MSRRGVRRWEQGARLLFVVAGIAAATAALIGWQSYSRVSTTRLSTGGEWCRGSRLDSPQRYHYRVIVRGVLRAPRTGLFLDGHTAWNAQGDEWPHGAFELQPGTLAFHSAGSARGRVLFVPEPGETLAGPVTVRFDLTDLRNDLYLPAGAALHDLEGELELEIWRRDPRLQTQLAAIGLATALILLTAAVQGWRRPLNA